MTGRPAPDGCGLPIDDVDTELPPLALGRAEAVEIMRELAHVRSALELLPYRTAVDPIRRLAEVCDTLKELAPGGFLDLCEGCGRPIGLDDPGVVSDTENGIYLCPACGPSPEEIAAQQAEIEAGDVDAVDRANAARLYTDAVDAALAEGWVEWNGGECPLHADAQVRVRLRSGVISTGRSAEFIWLHGDEINCLPPDEIVAYRMALSAPAPDEERSESQAEIHAAMSEPDASAEGAEGGAL
ncbi:hypothetical protein [Devosia ginsengisoli]|uniref:hypothetical protein n=1 Tax=Devosia ginsengisoli TaxID=400770 RepID=UPI0026EF8880|nr:hypothetical protein [Devosia ginsengisoli]MCR6673269.1 hypothetical protein [Devosia ginsengisoli]